MFDFGCHRIEVLGNVLGPIKRVKSMMANVAFTREVEDTAAALFQFESGACATLSVSHAACEPQDSLDIYGDHGSIHVPILNLGELTVSNGQGERSEKHSPDPNLHAPLIADFVAAVMHDREPAVNGETGRMVAEVEEQIYRDVMG